MTRLPTCRAVFPAALIVLPALMAAQGAAAQEAQPDNKWHGAISLGGAFASGNSSSRTLSATATGSKESVQDKISLKGTVNYGRSDVDGEKQTTADLALFTGRYDYNLTPVVFLFSGAEAETNKVADLDRRYTLNAGAGYKLLNTEATKFNVFAGIGYSSVKFVDSDENKGFELLFGEESSHQLSDTTTFKQSLVYYPGTSDIGNRATFDAGLATAILGGWTLNTDLAVRYLSKTEPGTKSTDTLLTVGFGYKF